ncbi:Arsenite-resistance protein 2-like protein [Aphelenchoides besseyi]|nr:Arsenite-resistance protein 2-like protein [Aphelenchoides besseyi]
MLTFEKFCETQDDKISDEDTIAKYNDYKLDFCKQEYEKFFQAHKDEQWFQMKYHSDMQKETNERNYKRFKKRLVVFTEITQSADVNADLCFDFDNCENIIRFMDVVVIKLEDGRNKDVPLVLKEPVVDDSDQNGGNSTSSQINRVAKNESATEESDGMAVLLKRVPYKPIASSSATLNQDLRSKTLKQNAITIRDTCVSVFQTNFRRKFHTSLVDLILSRYIFWNMKNAKFAEGDIQASVNRDLRRRIRTVNAISNHRQVVQNDIRQAACLLALYDYKRKIIHQKIDAIVSKSKNPVLNGGFDNRFVNAVQIECTTILIPISGSASQRNLSEF